MSQLKSARICNSDFHPVRYLLWAGMSHWLSHGDDAPFHRQFDGFPPHFHPHLQGAALDAQHAIGWVNTVKGLFRLRCRHIATLDMHHVSRIDNSQGNSRMRRSIIHATHEFTYNTWLSRNSDLHQKYDAEFLARIHLAESAEIRHYHRSPHLLALADRHYWLLTLSQSLAIGICFYCFVGSSNIPKPHAYRVVSNELGLNKLSERRHRM